ncbi:MAG: hypothetical protein IJ600_12870, partial [Lachnospiraceae bacterium]|nr:hypothetical protein [Lachnospiraceae bacterium]
MIMWKRIRKCIPVFIVCILLLFYIILWYKQFTYFHYSGESFFLSDERLNSIAQDAEEKEFIVEAAFSEKIGSVVFWPTIYSDITVENKGQETVVITISDYEGGDVPCAMEPVAIPADEEYRFVADGRGSYLITAYSSVQQGADDIHIQYDNHGYMNRWKKAVYALLGSVVLLVCVYMVFTLVKGEKISAVMPWVYFGGSLVAGLSGIVLRLSGWEDWSYTCLRFLAVYLGGLAVCSSIYKRDTESAGQNGASGKKKSYLCSLIISGGVALVFHFSFLTAKSTSILWHLTGTLDSGRRIKGYIIVFVVFLLTFLLLSNCRYSERILNLVKSFVRDKVSVCSIICILFILCDIHNEWNLLALAAFVLLIVYVRFQPEIRMPKWWWTLYYGVIVLLIAADHCVVDFWGIHGGGAVYHTGTFYHSIYYVANGLPFGGGLNQMYGHFALFYKLPLMLFGNNMLTVGMTTAFFSGIAACCLLIFLYRVLRNDGSRLIAGVVVLNCFVIGMIYLQTFPLRMLWPFALMLYCTLIKNENANIRVRLGGYVICILAIVWNMESGLVCAVAWAVCMAVWGQKKCRTQDYLLGMIRELIFVVAEVGIAYLLVKCYNTSCMDAAGRMDELLNWKKE